MNDFIAQHRKLVVVIALLIVGGLIALVIYTGRPQTDTVTPQDTGLDGGNESTPLPITSPLYTVNYATKEDGSTDTSLIEIDAPFGYRNAAVDALYDVNINPAEVRIQFNKYESPFKAYEQ